MPPKDEINIYFQQLNPKAKGTKAYERYEKYKKAKTIKEAKELGALAVDFKWDKASGYMTIHDDNLTNLTNICYDLLKENKELKSRLEHLEEYIKKQRKRNNYIEFLEQFKPEKSFDTWLSNIKTIDQKVFEKLYDSSFVDTMLFLFNKYYDDNSDGIIKCFNEKEKVFYIYNNDIWSKMDDEQYKVLFKTIYNCLIDYFKKWEICCFDSGSDKVMMTYLEVNQKIYTDINLLSDKFKTKLYNDLKISFRNHYND